jgi:TolB protein
MKGRGLVRRVVGWCAALVAAGVFVTPSAIAQTDLYVRGAGRLIPLGIPKLCLKSEENGPESTIPATMQKDLDLSGFFEIIDPKGYIESPGKCGGPEATVFSDWTAIGTEGLVKGEVSIDRGQITARLYLIDVQKQSVVIAKEYTADFAQAKMIAHRFANEIMKFYTGTAGVFGTQISFSSRVGRFKELFVMDMDGSNIRQLTNDRGLSLSSAWNPAGTKLVYTSYRNRTPDLFLMDVESRNVRQLTSTVELEIGAHFLDNDRIVFSRTEGSESDIVVMNLDGSGTRKLTPPNRAIDVSPVPSPDGLKIVFCSNRGGGPQIYVMGSDGSSPTRVSFGASNYCTSPAWSPTGDKIAYVCRADGSFNIFVANPDGSNAVQLTSSGSNEDPEFSADGRYLTFATTAFGGSFSIAIMKTDGTSMKRVTSSRGGDSEPAWGPLPK